MHVAALRYLVAVVDEGSFGKAARRLHVSQPSVSQAILRLEEQFGLGLLDRSGARVVATDEGARVIEDVRAALGHLDRALERAGGNTSVASLRIGCTSLAALWLVPELLAGFGAARPDVEVAVVELDVPAQAEALLAGRIDMTIGEVLPWHRELDAVVVREHPCAVWMAAAHPLASHTAIELAMLEGVPLTLGHPDVNPTYGPWVLEQLERAGVPVTIAPPVRDNPERVPGDTGGRLRGAGGRHGQRRRDAGAGGPPRSRPDPLAVDCDPGALSPGAGGRRLRGLGPIGRRRGDRRAGTKRPPAQQGGARHSWRLTVSSCVTGTPPGPWAGCASRRRARASAVSCSRP